MASLQVAYNSPAMHSGVRRLDVLLGIDGETVTGMPPVRVRVRFLRICVCANVSACVRASVRICELTHSLSKRGGCGPEG